MTSNKLTLAIGSLILFSLVACKKDARLHNPVNVANESAFLAKLFATEANADGVIRLIAQGGWK